MLRILSLSRASLSSRSHKLSSPFPIFSSPHSTLKQQNQGTEENQSRDPSDPPRLFVVQPRLRPATFLQAKLNEALCLANSLEEQRDGYFDSDFFDKDLPPHVIVQNPSLKSSKIRADTYFGPGTVENIKCHLNALESKDEVDAVFVNIILSGVQQRNLERILGKPVLDRVGLIIEIFNAHAHTKEAKLQAELAALMYKKSRLVRVRGLDGRNAFGSSGEVEVVSARGRGSGGRGFISGAGETELQLQRRRILERRNHLLSQIEEVRRTRAVQRAARKKRGGVDGRGLPTVAVVGYTNAGKSTLISALSDSDLYSDARLFATLDARLKSVVLPSGRKVLLSDTVGFISDLPVQLVEAFHSTLEEVLEANLLVHVIDCTAPNRDEHRSTVLQVLQQIGVSEEKLQNMIEVWNKIDYEEEMGADEYMDDAEYVELSDFSGAEDGENKDSPEEDCEVELELLDGKSVDGSDALKPSLGELEDTKQGDDSDGWLLSGDDSADDYWYTRNEQQQAETCNECKVEKDAEAQPGHVPDVKVSAVTGVGLQQLLELIDEKLKVQDEQLKSEKVVGNSFINRKWRPPRTQDEEWIESAEAQGHATVFVAKFFGRAGLMSFISAVPQSQRPALFQSLLFEACGRTVNPVNGAVGLLWTGNWHVCQEAVETVLRGGSLHAMPELMAPTPASEATCTDMWKLREETSANLNSRSKVSVSPKRKRVEEFKKLQPSDLDLCLTASFTGKRAADDRRPGTPSMNSEESVTTTCFELAFADQQGADKKLLNLFL
ncbi:hypothetical protein V6N13_145665 [Hibiscus sabdariffa]|uniref:Hflx-type G domain-containing protein n=1 Tax=Hibiscus sabdariffa TaxID=183260 RepID=A0ABR2TQ97_9ROSI